MRVMKVVTAAASCGPATRATRRIKRMDINNMVYTLGNGVGKTRGRAASGIRAIDDWRNCILSTGEQPISSDDSMDGINTRLLEINA